MACRTDTLFNGDHVLGKLIDRATAHGEGPAAGNTDLLVVDLINDMAFAEGNDLRSEFDTIVDVTAPLRAGVDAAGSLSLRQ